MLHKLIDLNLKRLSGLKAFANGLTKIYFQVSGKIEDDKQAFHYRMGCLYIGK